MVVFTLKQIKALIIVVVFLTKYNLNLTRCFHFGLKANIAIASFISADVYSNFVKIILSKKQIIRRYVFTF